MNQTNDQQIDGAIESLKSLFLSRATTMEQKHRLDSFGHELKALNALVNEKNSSIHKILSRI